MDIAYILCISNISIYLFIYSLYGHVCLGVRDTVLQLTCQSTGSNFKRNTLNIRMK